MLVQKPVTLVTILMLSVWTLIFIYMASDRSISDISDHIAARTRRRIGLGVKLTGESITGNRFLPKLTLMENIEAGAVQNDKEIYEKRREMFRKFKKIHLEKQQKQLQKMRKEKFAKFDKIRETNKEIADTGSGMPITEKEIQNLAKFIAHKEDYILNRETQLQEMIAHEEGRDINVTESPNKVNNPSDRNFIKLSPQLTKDGKNAATKRHDSNAYNDGLKIIIKKEMDDEIEGHKKRYERSKELIDKNDAGTQNANDNLEKLQTSSENRNQNHTIEGNQIKHDEMVTDSEGIKQQKYGNHDNHSNDKKHSEENESDHDDTSKRNQVNIKQADRKNVDSKQVDHDNQLKQKGKNQSQKDHQKQADKGNFDNSEEDLSDKQKQIEENQSDEESVDDHKSDQNSQPKKSEENNKNQDNQKEEKQIDQRIKSKQGKKDDSNQADQQNRNHLGKQLKNDDEINKSQEKEKNDETSTQESEERQNTMKEIETHKRRQDKHENASSDVTEMKNLKINKKNGKSLASKEPGQTEDEEVTRREKNSEREEDEKVMKDKKIANFEGKYEIKKNGKGVKNNAKNGLKFIRTHQKNLRADSKGVYKGAQNLGKNKRHFDIRSGIKDWRKKYNEEQERRDNFYGKAINKEH